MSATAAALRRLDQVVSGRSAAIVRGLPTVRIPDRPELTIPASITRGRHGHAHLFSAAIGEVDTGAWFGVLTTTMSRTVVDLARHNRWDGLMAADAALHAGVLTVADIRECLGGAVGWPGVRKARDVLELASPLAESPLESVTRLRLHDSGFPKPELQVVVPDPELGTFYRVDLLLADRSLAIEADGRDKYTDDQLWDEKRREARIRGLRNWRIERVIWRDITTDWVATRARLAT